MTSSAAYFVGSIPENYDTGLGPHIFEPYAADLAARVAALAPHDILELAAGTGIVSKAIHAVLSETSSLTVTDLNEPMLGIAQNKIGSPSNVSFQAVDACDLPFDDNGFDLIVSQFGVMFFPDKQRSFKEALRVLRPGGRYIFNVWGDWSTNPFARIAHETVAKRYPDDPPGFYKVPFSYNDPVEIERTLAGAGFSDLTIERVTVSNPLESLADFARGLIFGNPISQEIEERGGDCAEVRNELERELDRQLRGKLELEALVVTATSARRN